MGKGTVSAYIREHYPEIQLSVSATTRPPRPGEIDGVHYFFVSDAEFDRMIAAHELLEWARGAQFLPLWHTAPSHRGRPRGGQTRAARDRSAGRAECPRRAPERGPGLSDAPVVGELVRRLIGRGTEDPADQARRLETARTELAAQNEFDYRIVNTDVGVAAREVVELMAVRGAPSTRDRPLTRSFPSDRFASDRRITRNSSRNRVTNRRRPITTD